MSKDYAGLKFGRLTCLEYITNKNGRRIWLCKCECGNEKMVGIHELHFGNTSSCGCIKSKMVSARNMSLETLLDFLKVNALSKLQEIWLLHLSDSNSDEALIREKIAKVTGKLIYIP